MSQKKVDAYKEEKRNRQQIMRKERRMRRLEALAAAVICLALVGWFSYAVIMHVRSNAPVETVTTTLNLDAVDEYMMQLDELNTAQ